MMEGRGLASWMTLLALAPAVQSQVFELELADNFDRASLKGVEGYAYMIAEFLTDSYRMSPDGRESLATTPRALQRLAVSGAKSQPKVYGAFIGFVPGLINVGSFPGGLEGLKDGVRRQANGFGIGQTGAKSVLGESFTEFVRVPTDGEFFNETLYAPYAFNCTQPDSAHGDCSSMDGSMAYDYSDPSTTFFNVPRMHFEAELKKPAKMRSTRIPGIWVEPYFDSGAGSINMTTFAVPFGPVGDDGTVGKFLGVVGIDVTVESLCYTNCSQLPLCDPGKYLTRESRCAPCPAGSASNGGSVSSSTSCSAGKSSPFGIPFARELHGRSF